MHIFLKVSYQRSQCPHKKCIILFFRTLIQTLAQPKASTVLHFTNPFAQFRISPLIPPLHPPAPHPSPLAPFPPLRPVPPNPLIPPLPLLLLPPQQLPSLFSWGFGSKPLNHSLG